MAPVISPAGVGPECTRHRTIRLVQQRTTHRTHVYVNWRWNTINIIFAIENEFFANKNESMSNLFDKMNARYFEPFIFVAITSLPADYISLSQFYSNYVETKKIYRISEKCCRLSFLENSYG